MNRRIQHRGLEDPEHRRPRRLCVRQDSVLNHQAAFDLAPTAPVGLLTLMPTVGRGLKYPGSMLPRPILICRLRFLAGVARAFGRNHCP